MVKAYYRYRHAQAFGVVASPSCNPCGTADGLEVFTGGLENVQCWRVRQGVQVRPRQPRRRRAVYSTFAASRTRRTIARKLSLSNATRKETSSVRA